MTRIKQISIGLIALAGLMTVTNAAQAGDYDFKHEGLYYKRIAGSNPLIPAVMVVTEFITPFYYSDANRPKGDITIPKAFTRTEMVGGGYIDRIYEVTEIGDDAFSGCSDITGMTIPSSVKTIGAFAFYRCTSLKTVIVHWDTPLDVPDNIFGDVNTANVTLWVPKGKEEAYKAHPVWGKLQVLSGGIKPPKPPKPQIPFVPVTSVTLDQTTLNLNNVATYKLNATVLPNSATNPALAWTSSDNAIATVDATGLVTVRAKGSVVITASATDGSGVSASCTVQIHSVVANQAIEASRIYAADGVLRLVLPKAETVYIYHVNGALVEMLALPAGDHVRPLPAGVYVVRTGETVEKVIVK